MKTSLEIIFDYFFVFTAIALREMKQVLPYDITSLSWDKNHKCNTEEVCLSFYRLCCVKCK